MHCRMELRPDHSADGWATLEAEHLIVLTQESLPLWRGGVFSRIRSMIAIFKRIRRGLCYSEKYGSHPGTPAIVMLPLLGFVAGSWGGFLIMLGVFGPLYLFGAYERGD